MFKALGSRFGTLKKIKTLSGNLKNRNRSSYMSKNNYTISHYMLSVIEWYDIPNSEDLLLAG